MAYSAGESSKLKAGSRRPRVVPSVPVPPEPPITVTPPSQLEKLVGQLRDWTAAREKAPETTPEWWAYDSSYPARTQRAVIPAPPFPVAPEPTISTVVPEPVVPEAPATVWENVKDWFSKQATEKARVVSEYISGAVAEPKGVGLPRLNYLFGNPLPEESGKAWKKIAYVGFMWLGDETRRLVGWAQEMAMFPRLGGGALHPSYKTAMLARGTYVQAVTDQVVPVTMSEEERTAEIDAAREAQAAFTARYNELRAEGRSDVSATFEAVKEAEEKEAELTFTTPPIFGGVSTPESPIPWSEASQQAWAAAKGFRYSHGADPTRDRAYHELLEEGVDPVTAGKMTEDPAIELIGQLILDPNWALPLDNLLIKTAWGTTKKVAGVAADVGLRIPGIKGGLQWAGELTARTHGNYAARYADEILRTIKGYADSIGETVTPDMVKNFLESPPVEVLTRMPRYYQRALRGAAEYTDEIVKALNKTMTGAGLDEITETVTKQIAREMPNAPADVIASRVADATWEAALKAGSSASYVAALRAFTEAAQVAHPTLARILRTIKPLNNLLQGPKGLMVDTWLGLRPSWNVFNYADNLVKLLLDGVNPFSSLPALARRYFAYSPEVTEVADAVEGLRKIKFWNLSTASNEAYTALLHKVAPRQSLGTFGEAMARDYPSSLLAKVPVTSGVMAWNKSLAGRIEMSMRARAYYKSFFDTLDRGWTALTKRQATAIVNNVVTNLSDDVSRALVTRLQAIHNPTTATVNAVFRDMLVEGKLTVVVPTLAEDLRGALSALPPEITSRLQNRLNRIVSLGSQGPPTVLKADLMDVLEETSQEIAKYADDIADAARRSYIDTLPELPKTADEMYSILVQSGPDATMEELFQAVDDMPLLAARANVDSQAMTAAHQAHIAEMKKAKASAVDIAHAQDEFWTVTRPKFWTDFNDMQEATFARVADQVDGLLAARAAVTGAVAETYPRALMQTYIDAVRGYTNAETEIFKTWQVILPEVRKRTYPKAIRDEWMALGRAEADRLYKEAKILSEVVVHDVLVQSREWFVKNGLKIDTPVSMVDLAKGAGWWRVGQQIDAIPANARRFVDPMIEELRAWGDELFARRTAPYTEVPVSSADRAILSSYATQMQTDVTELISDSIDGAIKGTNDILFDYETTQNWMAALGNIFPFVRFPAKNIPMWIEKFAEVPHLAGSVAKVRAAQAAMNADLPSRQRYTVPIPRELTDWFLGPLGFDNTQLRVNPWSYFSIFQALPGATEFSRRQIEELGLDDGDSQIKQNVQVFATMSEELGFGMWPYLEWALGCWGLLGESWYPGDALGTWTPLVDWAMREVFGFDKSFDIDQHMRATLPTWWNYLFGNTPLAWQQLNPDLMEEWVQGREVEGVLMAMPDPAIVALMELTPTQAKEVVRGMAPEQVETIRAAILPLFSATSEEQAQRIPKLTLEERAVFLDEMEKVALRVAVRKQAFTTVLGNLTGLYAEPSNLGELEATQLRLQRRMEQESMEPGPERRDFMSQWYDEHPKYQAVQTWRFSEHPWAETSAGREAELWDATVDNYKTQYYEYNTQWREQYDAAIADMYREHPGDVSRLNALKDRLHAEKQEYIDQLNAKLSAEITRRMEEYIAAYPKDIKGIQLLREGWDTPVYVAVSLNAEEKEQLATYERTFPDDIEGYKALFQRLYEEARKRQPPTQMRHVPGLNEGVQMNLQWSPIGNANYSEEEIRQFLIQDLLEELESKAPDVEDYPTLTEGWTAYNEYMDNIAAEALKTEQVQSQIETLMREQKITKEEATAIVSTWYTAEELWSYWREWHSPWEALEYVYKWRVISEANEHFFEEVLPLKDGDDYDLYMLAREDLNLRYGPMPASDLIKFIMVDYPGKWTQAELERLFEGVVMPGYFDRLTFQKTGAEAVDSYIWYFYNMLDSAGKRGVREGFGELFQNQFLEGETEGLSIELRGSWLDYLSELAGQKMSWKTLPGIDLEIENSGAGEAQLQGMPRVSPLDMQEFEQAQVLNRRYWQLRLADDPAYTEIEANPLFQKWFEGGTPKSYFWNIYYTQVPPGPFSADLKNNPLVAIILNKDIRYASATNADYDRASEVIETWVMENAERMEAAGLNPADFDRVRELMDAYYAIPRENKEARKQFLADNPLLKMYFDAGKTEEGAVGTGGYTTGGAAGGGGYAAGGGGRTAGGGVRITTADSRQLWTVFRDRVGASLSTVLRMLLYYWSNGSLPGKSDAYLRKLHAELGGGLSFEDWLSALRVGWMASGTSGGISVRRVPEPPKPQYEHVTRGIRR